MCEGIATTGLHTFEDAPPLGYRIKGTIEGFKQTKNLDRFSDAAPCSKSFDIGKEDCAIWLKNPET